MEIKSLRSRRLCVLCVFVGLIRHAQQIRELSVFNGAKENAEDAETPRTQRVGVSLGQLLYVSKKSHNGGFQRLMSATSEKNVSLHGASPWHPEHLAADS
jgi:hypothetical protein